MKKNDIYRLMVKVRIQKPLVHHITNWVTISDCANVVKVLGASPVMAHAKEETGEMASLASALVLNIGTLTVELVDAMKEAALSANQKGIPVILDPCGAGATKLRDQKCLELLNETQINIIKGNYSEIAKLNGEDVKTRGVDSTKVMQNMTEITRALAKKRKCVVVATGEEDIISSESKTTIVANGHPMMSEVVGTGCMAASVIGAFAAVENNLMKAAVAGLVCYGIAAECAAKKTKTPMNFKEKLLDCLYSLDEKTVLSMQKTK